MRKLAVFDTVSADGCFVDTRGDMSWAHKDDPEWNGFVSDNASAGGTLVFGRVTYELMASFWPTPQAMVMAPLVAKRMNSLPKNVFSRGRIQLVDVREWRQFHALGKPQAAQDTSTTKRSPSASATRAAAELDRREPAVASNAPFRLRRSCTNTIPSRSSDARTR
jgi:dihydrofolate reductase